MLNQNFSSFLKFGNHTILLKYMLMGAIGFGIGGFFPFNLYPDVSDYFPTLNEIVIFGAIGGIFMGILSKNIKKIIYLALIGSVGFSIGFIISFLLLLNLFIIFIVRCLVGIRINGTDILPESFASSIVLPIAFFICFMLGGLIMGMFYGIALRNKRAIKILSIAGGFGFAFAGSIVYIITNMIYGISDMPLLFGVGGTSAYIIFGIIAGIFLGTGMYFAEKPSVSKSPRFRKEGG
ncbi:hypothetical protein AMJ49_05615 [Parcubacteria bacterium DG_74_2]|nr:MAG: hypothetical protein AMJ49_05615 [Parcubacteria bacterium DG_74_2]